MKPTTAWLVLILLGSIALRCIGLESRGIWYDDAFSIFLAGRSLPALLAGTAADTMPPLYFLLLHFWLQISSSLWFLRLVGLAFSVASIWMLFRVTARLFGKSAGLWAALLAAISPFQIYHAQELRPYTLLAFAELGYVWFFIRIWEKSGQAAGWHWVGLVLCGTAAMYTHNLAAFVIIVPDVFLFVRRSWRLLGRLIAAQVGILILALPWLLILPGQLNKISGGWSIQPPGLTEILQSIIITTSNLPLPGFWLAIGLLISLWTLALLVFELARGRSPDAGLQILSAFALVPPVLMGIASYITTPVFVTRGFILSHLAYAALASVVISRTWPRMGWFFLAMFVAGAAIALPYQYTFHEFPRSPYRQAAAYLETAVQPGDRVVNDNKLSYFPMHYYQPEMAMSFIRDVPLSNNDTYSPVTQQALQLLPEPDLETAVGSASRVYYIVFTRAIEEYRESGEPDHPGLIWLRQGYRLADHLAFSDLEIYRFER